jgi:MFS family permease
LSTRPPAPTVSPNPAEDDSATRLSPTVVRLGFVSLLTDVASDMIIPLLPIFLTTVLHASLGFVGAVDGAAETTASLLKVLSGRLADRVTRRKPLVVAGYALAALVRPLVALAFSPWHVLAVRVTDRIGKGVRSAPRDAWIASVTPPKLRGRAFGLHRAMDNLGGFLGPLLGLLLHVGLGLDLRWTFALASVPGFLGVIVLLTTRDSDALAQRTQDAAVAAEGASAGATTAVVRAPLPRALVLFYVVLFFFALAGSSDAFVILRAKEAGASDTWVLLLWTGFSGLRALLATHGAMLSDRFGRRGTLLAGWVLYALVYVAFAFVDGIASFAAVLAIYAGFYALTEGTERALVADLAPESTRGTAFGLFHGVLGLAALPASLLFGVIADATSMRVAFLVDAGIASLAVVLLALLLASTRRIASRR